MLFANVKGTVMKKIEKKTLLTIVVSFVVGVAACLLAQVCCEKMKGEKKLVVRIPNQNAMMVAYEARAERVLKKVGSRWTYFDNWKGVSSVAFIEEYEDLLNKTGRSETEVRERVTCAYGVVYKLFTKHKIDKKELDVISAAYEEFENGAE